MYKSKKKKPDNYVKNYNFLQLKYILPKLFEYLNMQSLTNYRLLSNEKNNDIFEFVNYLYWFKKKNYRL